MAASIVVLSIYAHRCKRKMVIRPSSSVFPHRRRYPISTFYFVAGSCLTIGQELAKIKTACLNHTHLPRSQSGGSLTVNTISTAKAVTIEDGILGLKMACHRLWTAVTRPEPCALRAQLPHPFKMTTPVITPDIIAHCKGPKARYLAISVLLYVCGRQSVVQR